MAELKKRELLNTDPDAEKPMLQDLINSLVNLSGDVSKLEYNDNKTAVSATIKGLVEHEKLVTLYKVRMRKLKEEIMTNNKKKGTQRPDNTEYLPN